MYYNKVLDKKAMFFKSYGHMIAFYLTNFSGSTMYMALGINHTHFKNKYNANEWKDLMIRYLNEAFPEPSLEKSMCITTLEECVKEIIDI